MDLEQEQKSVHQQETDNKQPETLEQKLVRLKEEKAEKEKAEQEAAALKEEQEKASRAESLQNEKNKLEENIKQVETFNQEIASLQESVHGAEQKLQDMIIDNAEVLSEIGDIKNPEDLLKYPELSDSPEVTDWQRQKEQLDGIKAELATLSENSDLESKQARLGEINLELGKYQQASAEKEAANRKEQVENMAGRINSILDVEQLLKSGEDEELVRLGWMEKPGAEQVKELQFNDILLKIFEEQNNKEIDSYQEKLVDRNSSDSLVKTVTEIKTAKEINLENPAIGNSVITIENNGQIKVFAELPQLYQEMKVKERAIEELDRKIAIRENEHSKKTIKMLDRSYEQDIANLKQEVQKADAERKAIIEEYNLRTASKNKLEQHFNQNLYPNAKTWIIKARTANPQITINEILLGLEQKAESDARFNPSQEEKDDFQTRFEKRKELRQKAGKSS